MKCLKNKFVVSLLVILMMAVRILEMVLGIGSFLFMNYHTGKDFAAYKINSRADAGNTGEDLSNPRNDISNVPVGLDEVNRIKDKDVGYEGGQPEKDEVLINNGSNGQNKAEAKSLGRQDGNDIINILLFGLDRTSPDEPARSDTIIIATLDRKQKKVKLTSLMRDMYVEIPDYGYDRINAAYAFGEADLALRTINKNFDMNISYYMTIDFFGMIRVIDKLGGVPIEIKEEEIKVTNDYIKNLNSLDKETPKSPLITKAGLQVLNGKQAVGYSRVRYVGNGDFERTGRQRTILKELMKKGKDVSILELPDLILTLMPFVETNLTYMDILNLAISAFELRNVTPEQLLIPAEDAFEGAWVDGMNVIMPDIEKNREILHEFIYGAGN